MLSVIVYGRNDSHGYNLARRAVLSLNCLAQLLDAEGDEIIFVDYNTPDDLPGFIEANRDALTARARRVLRVLRVRPDQHARFAGRTHLPVLEGIARNVALRRADPANRWILSTNSDIIVTLRDGVSLSSVVAGLEDGFYHAPRYELPQIIWESLDRSDPATAMARLADLGPRLHLNEIVRTLPSHGVDSPGDFQLALRRDLFDLRGFDEDMLLGWHLDANLARRLSFRYGPVRLLENRLAVYHCDHTRQATLTHGAGHLENDWKRFVDDLDPAVADLPAQAETWGMAGETVEEVDVVGDPAAAYFAALANLPPPCVHEYLKVSETFNDLNYAPEHVLPYLLDLLSALPRRRNLGYFGCRPRMEKLLRDGWAALGFTGEILTGEAALDRADVLMFEFGLVSADEQPGDDRDGRVWHDDDLEKLWTVRAAFDAAAAVERLRAPTARRRIVLINAIHNIFEAQVAADVAAVHTPFSTRLRQGFIRDAVAARRDRPADQKAEASADRPDETGSRVPNIADWENPAWNLALRRGFGRDALEAAPRDLWYWERGSILHILTELGLLREQTRALTVAVTPEPLYAALTALVGRVDVVDWRAEPTDDPAWRRPLPLLRPSRLHFFDDDPADGTLFDVVIMPHNVVLKDGVAGMTHALAGVRRLLKPEGVLIFSADVRIAAAEAAQEVPSRETPGDGCGTPPWLEGRCLSDGALAEALERLCGLRLCAPPPLPSPPSPTPEDGAFSDVLTARSGDGLFTRLIGVARPIASFADEPREPAATAAAAAALGPTGIGPQLSRLSLGDGARRIAGGAVEISPGFPARLALFGPYLAPAPGRYRLVTVAHAEGDDPDVTALEVQVRRSDGMILAKQVFSVGFLSRSPAVLYFDFPVHPANRVAATVEFQFFHFHTAPVRIEVVDLEDAAVPSPRLWREGAGDSLLGPLLPRLSAHGRRTADGAVEIPPGPASEDVLWGPYLGLAAGDYRLTFSLRPLNDAAVEQAAWEILATLSGGDDFMLARLLPTPDELRAGVVSFVFTMPRWCAVDGAKVRPLEVRLTRRIAGAALAVDAVDLARTSPEDAKAGASGRLTGMSGPLLPRLLRAFPTLNDKAGRVRISLDDAPGCVLYGPYTRLTAGRYELRIAAVCGAPANPTKPLLAVEVLIGDRSLKKQQMDAVDFLGGEALLVFDVSAAAAFDIDTEKTAKDGLFEVRISHFANAEVMISAVDLRMAE